MCFRYFEFDQKNGHYLSKRSKKNKKNEEMRVGGSPSPLGESPISLKITFCSSVLNPEGKDKIDGEKEQSAH